MTTTVVVIEALVIVLLSVLVGGLLKSHAEILRQLHALGVDEEGRVNRPAAALRPKTTGFERAPETSLSGVGIAGDVVNFSLEHGKGHTLLAFLSSGCSSCRMFWSEFQNDFELPAPDTRTLIVTKGPESESAAKIRELAPTTVPVLMSTDVWDAFEVPMTPYFQLVDGTGMIVGEGASTTWQHLLGLLRQSEQDSVTPHHLDTEGRAHFSDVQLRASGLDPGDPSLYENPMDKT